MHKQMQEPMDVVRQQLSGERLVDEDVTRSVGVLADRLARLKRLSPMFAAVSFSPEVEAMTTAKMALSA